MKRLAVILVAVLCAGLSFGAEPLNVKDPISMEAVNPAIKSRYSKTVEFCCDRCKGKFDASPKAYMAAIKSARKGQCPLSNKASVPGKKSVYVREVAFASVENKAKFDGSPDQYIDKVK
jgi:YHS domain-containing protein